MLAQLKFLHANLRPQDPDDLPFHKGEILTVVSKDEEQWWTARNALGQTGSIPVPYVSKVSHTIFRGSRSFIALKTTLFYMKHSER